MLNLKVSDSNQGKPSDVALVAMDLNQVLWDTGERDVIENGVKVHLPDLHEAMFNKALQAYGHAPMNHAEYEEKFQGKSSQQKLELMGIPQFDAQGRDQWKLISEEKTRLTVAEAPRYLDAEQVEAMRAKLEAVKASGAQVALVTNSDRDTLDFALKAIGSQYVDVVVSKDDKIEKDGELVKVKAKPAPDMLLLAAEKAGVSMDEVMFVTNPGLGVKAGQAAGVGAIAMVNNARDFTPATITQAIGMAEHGQSGQISASNAMSSLLDRVHEKAAAEGFDPNLAMQGALKLHAGLQEQLVSNRALELSA